jgi:hypothetical protein
VISAHKRGPLLEIGSLATCTKIGEALETISFIFPSLMNLKNLNQSQIKILKELVSGIY